MQNRDGSPLPLTPHAALPADRVRFVGEAVAMVVAETVQTAKEAAERVAVHHRADVDTKRALGGQTRKPGHLPRRKRHERQNDADHEGREQRRGGRPERGERDRDADRHGYQRQPPHHKGKYELGSFAMQNGQMGHGC